MAYTVGSQEVKPLTQKLMSPSLKRLRDGPPLVPICIITACIAVTVNKPLTSVSLRPDFSPHFHLMFLKYKSDITSPFHVFLQGAHSHKFKTLELHLKPPQFAPKTPAAPSLTSHLYTSGCLTTSFHVSVSLPYS